jgi:glycosyltransferase involved in cell wall biosynthesis
VKILHITNLYPTNEKPDYGIFVKEQIEGLNAETGLQCDTYVIRPDLYGMKAYFKAIVDLRKNYAHYDVYHAHHVFSGVVSLLTGRRKKRVVSLLSNRFDVEPKLWFLAPFIYFFVMFFSDKLITKFQRKSLFHNKFVYLPNGVDTSFFSRSDMKEAREELSIPDDAFVPLFVSSKSLDRQEKRKDLFDSLIANVTRLKPGMPILPLYMCNIDRERIPLYFNAANIHILLSDFEGSPNSVKEALSCGCPVLAADVGDVGNLLANVNNTLKCNQNDIHSDAVVNFVISTKSLDENERERTRVSFLKRNIGKNAINKQLKELYVGL